MNSSFEQHVSESCPPELLTADPNAGALWMEFLKRAGIAISADKKRVLDTSSRRAYIIARFAIPSLLQRLTHAKDELSRARVWWRESIAASAGESPIPDLEKSSLYLLNPFIVTPGLKFPDPRSIRLAAARDAQPQNYLLNRRGRPRTTAEKKRADTARRNRARRARLRDAKIPSTGKDAISL